MNANLYLRFQQHVRRDPDHPALRDERGTVTYAELDWQAGAVAMWLRARGVAPGGHVALHLSNCRELVVAYYGAVRAGAIPVPLHPGLAGDEFTFLLGHANARLLISASTHLDALPSSDPVPQLRHRVWAGPGAASPGWTSWAEVLATPGSPEPALVADRDMAVLHYTSGTTGRPKGVMFSHAGLVRSADVKAGIYGVGPKDVIYPAPPLAHAGSANSAMQLALTVAGATLALRARFDVAEAAQVLATERVTFAWMVPTMYLRLLDLPELRQLDLSSLRGLMYASMPMPADAVRALRALLPWVTLFHSYGGTENGPLATCLIGDEVLERPGSAGRAHPPSRVQVVGKDGHPLPPGEVGAIWVQSPGLMLGYYRDPGATTAAVVDGWHHTGDLGYLDEDGYLYFVGRQGEMINRGGYKISPAEVEEVLLAHPGVLEAAVVGEPDQYLGQRVLAVVVRRSDSSVSAEDLQAHCQRHLSRPKIPATFQFTAVLPKNSLGKVQKHLLIPSAPTCEA